MNNYVMLIISVSANLFGSIFKKDINSRYSQDMFSYQFYNAVVSLFSMLVLLIMTDTFTASPYTIILAVVFGIITLLQQLLNLYALENGPFSYTTVIISLSTLIPTLSGALFWHEKIVFTQYIGIALLIICIVLSVNARGEKKANVKWLFFSVAAFICTGFIGVMQKIHQTSAYKNELDSFLIIAFFVSFLVSSVYSAFCYRKHKSVKSDVKSVLNIYPVAAMVISGVFVAVNNKFNLYLSGVMESAVFFPIVNGGGLILTSISAFVIFKEKLTKKQQSGILIGIISVVLLCFK